MNLPAGRNTSESSKSEIGDKNTVKPPSEKDVKQEDKMGFEAVPVSDIKVDKRLRRNRGNLGRLAQSILRVGILHPVVVDSDRNLIAGLRRLEVVKGLGWKTVPATIVNLKNLEAGELEENLARKAFAPSEIAEIGEVLEHREIQRRKNKVDEAKERGKLPQEFRLSWKSTARRTRDEVAQYLDVSPRTYQKIKDLRLLTKNHAELGEIWNRLDKQEISIDRAYHETIERINGKAGKNLREEQLIKNILGVVGSHVRAGWKIKPATISIKIEEGKVSVSGYGFSELFLYKIGKEGRAEVVEIKPRRLGNIYPSEGQAGNVFDKDALAPTVMPHQMLIADTDKSQPSAKTGLA